MMFYASFEIPQQNVSRIQCLRYYLLICRTSTACLFRIHAEETVSYFRLTVQLIAVDIPWEDMLRIHEDTDGKDRLIITCIHSLAKFKPPQYEPRIYEFILSPASQDCVRYISKVLNFAAFKNSGPTLSSRYLIVAPPAKRFKIFINPKSGKGKAVKLFTTLVKPILVAAGCEIVDRIRDGSPPSISHVVVTTGPKEAMREAANIPLNNFDAILCVGGDGTVHEVVNGLANRPDGRLALDRLPIAMIPAGTSLLDISDILRIWY